MMRTCISGAVMLVMAVGASADTFTAEIILPAGHLATPGQPLAVQIRGTLTSDDPGNDGLAYFSVDFAMSGAQPVNLGEALTLAPPEDGSMAHFVSPLGFAPHYGGQPVGDLLIQAGGTQNTFGNDPSIEPFLEAPSAEYIVMNVAYAGQVLLEGTLTLPIDAALGTYTLSVRNLHANMLGDGQRLESFGRYTVEPAAPITGGAVHIVTLVDADFDGSGQVDAADLAVLLAGWGLCPKGSPCAADLDGNGSVDAADLALLLGNWG